MTSFQDWMMMSLMKCFFSMKRLENIKYAIFDANVIIYQCFPNGKYRIIGLTKPAKDLTNFLINQDSFIIVPHFIISEIEQKGFINIIDDYFAPKNINQICEPPKHVDEAFKFKLMRKVRSNYNALKQNDNFLIEEYEPSSDLMESINNAFTDFNSLPYVDEYLRLKHADYVNPSDADKKLILFSKEKECPLITNDLDITFFCEEISKRNLTFEIIEFKSISSSCA